MSETRFQFRVDGRAGNSPIRDTWAEAAEDAVRDGYACWRKRGVEIAFSLGLGGEIARLPGISKDAEIASLRAQLDEARAAFTQIREHTKDVVDDDLIAVVDMIAEDFLDPSKRAPLRALLSESKT